MFHLTIIKIKIMVLLVSGEVQSEQFVTLPPRLNLDVVLGIAVLAQNEVASELEMEILISFRFFFFL